MLKFAFDNGNSVNSKFYGFPIARIGLTYCLMQVVLSVAFMALGQWLPIWIPIVVYVVMLGAAAIGCIGADSVREEVVRQDIKIKTDTNYMKTTYTKVKSISENCEDTELRKAVEKLAEDIRYSDVVSSPALAEAEYQLYYCISELETAIGANDTPKALALTQKAQNKLSERNRLCKLNK